MFNCLLNQLLPTTGESSSLPIVIALMGLGVVLIIVTIILGRRGRDE